MQSLVSDVIQQAVQLCVNKKPYNGCHPELNPIERVWSRMKWFIRQWVDGSIDTLTNLVFQGLSYPNYNITNNLILKTVKGPSGSHMHACKRTIEVSI